MQLSVSVRIAEGFLSKEIPIRTLDEVCRIANEAGYPSICMRASQVGVHSTEEDIANAVATIQRHGLTVSMITGDFDTVYNNEHGPNALRNIGPYIRLAQSLGASLIRVALKRSDDVSAAREAADRAAEAGLNLVHQCHTLSLFETVDGIVDTLTRIDRKNFGLIYEPANLELCRQPYAECIETLAPWIMNVYLQNQILKPDGSVKLDTWCNGPTSFDIVPIHQPGGIDFASVFRGLRQVGYDGTVTVHQSAGEGEDPLHTTKATADFLRNLLSAAS